jgi:hypothetical protein
MFSSYTTFIGIDPTAGLKPFTYAALDQDLHLLALGEGSIDDMLAFAGGQRQAYVAVCAPTNPNLGLMNRAEVRESLSPPPRPGRWLNFRVAEYQLRQYNIACPQTYANSEECANWMRMGFSLHQKLRSAGYCPYPGGEAPLQLLEVYPHACYCVMLGVTPFPKYTFEGRIQRQLALQEKNVRVADPMRLFEEITRHKLLQGILRTDDLLSSGELDALAGAYTAWKAALHPVEVTLVGHPEEGQVVIPAPQLKEKYT